MIPQSNHLKDYEKIIRLIGDHVALNPNYAIELLDATFRQILLSRVRLIRDASKEHHEKIYYAKRACIYSEGDPEDLMSLANAYQEINEEAQANALMYEASKNGNFYRGPFRKLSEQSPQNEVISKSGANKTIINKDSLELEISIMKTTTTSSKIMDLLYGENIWEGFNPVFPKEKIEGWNGNHPIFEELIEENRPQIVVDVGVWKGLSTTTLAKSLKSRGIDGCVISIDTFLGSPEHWDYSRDLFKRRHGYPDLYEQFMANVFHAELSDYVIPMPQLSNVAASLLKKSGIKASLIHIDAAHEYEEVLRDAIAYWDILEPGGVMVGDDYHPTWPGVVRAADEFAGKVGRELLVKSPKWILRK